MSEQDQPQDITGAKQDIVNSEEMDVDTARQILQALTDAEYSTNERQRLGDYSIDQVRQAERVVAQDIVENNNAITGGGQHPFSIVNKDTPQGRLVLSLTGDTVEVSLHRDDKTLLRNSFSLIGNRAAFQPRVGYRDFRPGLSTDDSRDANRTSPVEELRKEWYNSRGDDIGLKWMSANMINWQQPITTMPEQLGQKPPQLGLNSVGNG